MWVIYDPVKKTYVAEDHFVTATTTNLKFARKFQLKKFAKSYAMSNEVIKNLRDV